MPRTGWPAALRPGRWRRRRPRATGYVSSATPCEDRRWRPRAPPPGPDRHCWRADTTRCGRNRCCAPRSRARIPRSDRGTRAPTRPRAALRTPPSPRSAGCRGALLDHPRVARRGERSGTEIGAHVYLVGIDPADIRLRLGYPEPLLDEAPLLDVELADHARVRTATGQLHQRQTVAARPQRGRALPNPVLVLLRPQRLDAQQHFPVRPGPSVLLQRRAPPQAPGVSRVLPEVVKVSPAPPDQRDAVVSVEHLAALGTPVPEPGTAGQLAGSLRVATPDPVQGRGPR